MIERYIVFRGGVIDTHDKSRNPEGNVVCTADPVMAAHIAALLNEDIVITGYLEMSRDQTVEDMVDDVVRHTKGQQ